MLSQRKTEAKTAGKAMRKLGPIAERTWTSEMRMRPCGLAFWVHRWVAAEDVGPGEKLRYTVFYVNQGDEPATEVRIENPIPELTVYVSDSATGQGSTIMFSADGGEQYDAADSVTYQVRVFGGGTDRRLASAERFTNIRWMIDRVPPGSMGEVSFEVVVE